MAVAWAGATNATSGIATRTNNATERLLHWVIAGRINFDPK